MINPKDLLKQLCLLHAKQPDNESWPTLEFQAGRAIFATHVSADTFGKGVGFRFAVPVDQRPRFGALPAPLPEGVFAVKGKALSTMQASVAKSSDELFRIEPAADNGGWVNFRVGAGAVVDLERITTGVLYPLSAMGTRAPMGPDILDELLRLKEVVKLTKNTPRDSFEVLVRLGPNGAESADTHRLVIRTSACWPEDLWISGAHLQRAHVLVRKDAAAKLTVTGTYVLLTGQNWELAMPKMQPSSDYPNVSGIIESREPITAKITLEVSELVNFLAAGRIASGAMKATGPLFVLCLVDGEYVPEYAAVYETDSDKTGDYMRALPLDPWVRPDLEVEVFDKEKMPDRIAVNPTYLMDAILYVGKRTMTLEVGPAQTAVFITAGDRAAVVMPCRLDNFIYGLVMDPEQVKAATA
jgi:hypothetical protein